MNTINYQATTLDKSKFPMIAEFIDILESKNSNEKLPSWKDLSFSTFPSYMIPNIILIDVTHDPLRFQYRFIGTAITSMENRDETGIYIDQLKPDAFAESVFASYKEIIQDKEFVVYNMNTSLNKGNLDIANGVRIPLSNDGTRVDHVLSIIHLNTSQYQLQDFYDDFIRPQGAG